MKPIFDIEVCVNNSVRAYRPTETGRLKDLVRKTKDGLVRVWIFRDILPWKDDDGDERIAHHHRGLSCGIAREGLVFEHLCLELGLTVARTMFFVPCSNGEACYGEVTDLHDARVSRTAEFTEVEQKLVRWDLPTRADLLRIIMSK